MARSTKKSLIKFVPEKNGCHSEKINSDGQVGVGPKASEQYQEIISVSSQTEKPQSSSSSLKSDWNSHRIPTEQQAYIEFHCDHCGLVRAKSIYHHNLSTEHQFKSIDLKQKDDQHIVKPLSDDSDKNYGYKLMLKQGWSGTTGLGRQEQGRKYPILPKKKQNRHGIGFEKHQSTKRQKTDKIRSVEEATKTSTQEFLNKKQLEQKRYHEKQLEYQFRKAFHQQD